MWFVRLGDFDSFHAICYKYNPQNACLSGAHSSAGSGFIFGVCNSEFELRCVRTTVLEFESEPSSMVEEIDDIFGL